MARLEVILAETASADLDHLFLYILENSGFARTAKAFTDRIIDRCYRLGDFPAVGRSHPDIMPDLRTVPFESVVIVYLIGTQRVEILRIIPAARDYETFLRNP